MPLKNLNRNTRERQNDRELKEKLQRAKKEFGSFDLLRLETVENNFSPFVNLLIAKATTLESKLYRTRKLKLILWKFFTP